MGAERLQSSVSPRLPLVVDLLVVLTLMALTALSVVLPVIRETPIRIALGLVMVLFLPGYALLAALFPTAGYRPRDDYLDRPGRSDSRSSDSIDGLELAILAVGTSIALVTAVGIAVELSPWQFDGVTLLVGLGTVTLLLTVVAARRRLTRSPDASEPPSVKAWLPTGLGVRPGLLDTILVVCVLLAVVGVGYAVMADSDSGSELYLLTEDESGDLVAGGYPTNITRGEASSVVVGVENHGRNTVRYTVVVELQRVTTDGGRRVVTNRSELARFSTRLAPDERDRRTVQLDPTRTGDDLRIAFALFRGVGDPDPSVDDPVTKAHLWVDVSDRR